MDDDGLLDGEEIVQTTDQYGRVFFQMLSYPNRADSDNDGILDGDDVRPMIFDIVPTLMTEDKITFNTGRVWDRLLPTVTAYKYCDDIWSANSNGEPHTFLSAEEINSTTRKIKENAKSEYAFEELQYIILMDVEGAKFYLDEKTPELRKQLFESLVGRDSKTLRFQGRSASQKFVEVEEGTEGGFWSGKVITEYDLNLSTQFYFMAPDVNDWFDGIIISGSVVMTLFLVYEVSVITAANLQAIQYYCKNWGIKEGLDYFWTLGTQYVPNGILSQIQFYQGDPDPHVKVPVEKFRNYIFKENADHGKNVVFEKLGYSRSDSEYLANLYKEQGRAKYNAGNYTLGKLDEHGQRINIEIELRGIGDFSDKVSYLKSGWMINADGSISFNTPFTGFTQ